MPNTLYFSAEGDATTKVVQFYNPVLQTWVDGTLVDSVTKKYTATMAGIPAGTYNGLKSRLKGSSPEIIKIYSEGVTVRDGNTPNPGTGTKASVPIFGTLDDTNNIVGLTSAYSYTEVMWGPEGGTMQQLASNSICSPGNIAGRLQAYVVANTAAGRLQSDTVYSAPFTMTATANNKPTATLNVAGGVTTVTPGQSVTLELAGADTDAGDSISKIEALDNGVKIGEITGASGFLQTLGLSAGSHSFTAKAYDSKGETGLSIAMLVRAATAATGKNRVLMLFGNSNVAGQGGSLQDPLMTKLSAIVAATGETDTTRPYNYAVPTTTTANAFDQIKQFMPGAYAENAGVKDFVIFVGDFYNSIRKDPNRTPAMEIALLQQISAYVKGFGTNVKLVAWTPGADDAFTPDLALLDRPGINDELHAMATALRAERDRPGSSIDALADIDAETVIDMTSVVWTGDGIHGNDKAKAVQAQRIAWAIRQAIYGTPQPAPILRSDENYATGAKVLTLSGPFASSSGALVLNGSAVPGYNNVGVDKYYLKANESGCWISKIQTGDGDVVTSFSPNTNALGYDTYPCPAWVSGPNINVRENGANKNVGSATNGYFFGEYRDAVTGIRSVFISPDKVVDSTGKRLANAVTLYSYPTPDKTAQYIKGDGFGPTGQISYLQGLGLTLIPGQSASGEGPVTGALTFGALSSGIVKDASGNYNSVNGGGAAYKPNQYIAPGTSGGVSMKVTSLTDYSAFLGFSTPVGKDYEQRYNANDFPAGFAFRAGKLGISEAAVAAHFTVLQNVSLALGEEYRAYFNKDNGVITVDVLRVGATTWTAGIYTFAYTTTEGLWPVAPFNDAGSYLQSPTIIGGTLVP